MFTNTTYSVYIFYITNSFEYQVSEFKENKSDFRNALCDYVDFSSFVEGSSLQFSLL